METGFKKTYVECTCHADGSSYVSHRTFLVIRVWLVSPFSAFQERIDYSAVFFKALFADTGDAHDLLFFGISV